jgi:hypothetical protein
MYRSVVSQQGRVTLEADANEAEEIRAQESCADLIDVIGPAGVPGDGFKIAVPAEALSPFDFSIGQGTFYVGGLRVTNPDGKATYLHQGETEWIDYPAGRATDYPEGVPLIEAAYLTLAEHEVSAVEDEALREVALGGPDTAARVRLLQRVQRRRVGGSTCQAAFAQVLKTVYADTADFDPATMRLVSKARLRVDFAPPPGPIDVCQPTARAEFLGTENQLIRVQVSDTGRLLWGWDNASFLYRVTITTSDPGVVTLDGIPVDVFHQPRAGQYVELLGTAVDLGGGAYMASPVGLVLQVDGYDVTSRHVTLKTALPADFAAKHPKQLFLRIWENQLEFAADQDTPTVLTDRENTSTGVRVFASKTLRIPGDHWMIGVRPSRPQTILPARLAVPQPPDGPRRWVAPLARIEWERDRQARSVTDCRAPFLDLVALTRRKPECCELVVSPEAHESKTLTLQDAINTVVTAGGGTICLQAGVYKLERPLVVNGAMSFRITGRGPNSRLLSDGPAINVSESAFVTLDAFRVECTGAKGSNAIVVGNSSQVRIERLRIDGDSGWAGIALRGALEDVAIRENWITADAGIIDLTDPKIGATGLADLRVEDNLFLCSSVGVRLANVSVHQGVSRFAGNRVLRCRVAGFQLQGATVPGCAVDVIGNTLEVTGVGILTGLDGIRIADNDLTPGRDTRGTNGIVMTTGSAPNRVDDAQIAGNRITRFDVGIRTEVPLGSVSITRNQISTSGTGLLIISSSLVNLTIDANQISDIDKTAIVIATENGRITVADNHLQTTGEDPIVTVTCAAGDCLFCQNHCAGLKTDDKIPTVHLTARTLVLASNRVGGGVALSCANSRLTKVPQPLCTVLGNVSGTITINTNPLTKTPWEPLNVPNA